MGYDVAIIGSGPAGCTAALTLARAGRSVIMFEKQRFPRPKVCGGCLSGWAVEQLHDLLGKDCQLPGTPGSDIAFSIGGRLIRCPTGNRTRVVSRSEFDSMLAERARFAGAEIRFGQPAGIARSGEIFELIVGGHSFQAGTILVASGLSGLATKNGFRSRPFGAPMIGQQWFTSARAVRVAPGAVEMHWLRGGYVGLAAPNEADCIVALAMHAKTRSGVEPLLTLQRMNPGAEIWNRVDSTQNNQIRGAAGFPFVPDRLALANVMLIGDAAGYSEPFSGTGIGMAIYSGTAAARSIISGGGAREYVRALRLHRRAMWRTRTLGATLNSNLTQRMLRVSNSRFDNLVSKIVQWVHVRSAI